MPVSAPPRCTACMCEWGRSAHREVGATELMHGADSMQYTLVGSGEACSAWLVDRTVQCPGQGGGPSWHGEATYKAAACSAGFHPPPCYRRCCPAVTCARRSGTEAWRSACETSGCLPDVGRGVSCRCHVEQRRHRLDGSLANHGVHKVLCDTFIVAQERCSLGMW